MMVGKYVTVSVGTEKASGKIQHNKAPGEKPTDHTILSIER